MASANQLLGQAKQDSTRILRAYVYTDEGEPYIGLTVYQYGTIHGAITQVDGGFQLQIPANQPTLVHIPFCFNHYYRVVKPEEKEITIKLTKKEFKKSKKVFRKWKSI